MYDSVGLWMPSERIKWSGYKESIPALLSNPAYTEKSNGIWWINGSLENLRVSVGEAGISIKGSPNKFYHGYNYKRLTRQEFEMGIEKLSDALSIKMDAANTSRIDIAHNFCMKEEVSAYYPFLGNCQYYLRQKMDKSLYYKNKQRTLLFYDKVAEGGKNGIELPNAWTGKNVLRFEVRFLNRLLSQFNRASMTAKDLYSEAFYTEIVDRWVMEYNNIKKNKLMKPNIGNLTSKKAKDYLLSALVQELGHNKAYSIVDEWNDSFTTKKEVQRFKKSLEQLSGLTVESSLIQELDKKINGVKEYYR